MKTPIPTPGRSWTEDVRVEGGGIITIKRACNGCQRLLGDVLDAELEAAISGRPLPDVRDECGCVGGAP